MKKLISMLVITMMIFSMVASLNIMSVSAASSNKYEFKHYDEATSKIYTDHDGTNFRGVCFTISSTAKYGNVTYYPDGINGTDEPVLDIISDKYLWNSAKELTFDKPIVDINFQYYLPSGTENNPRFLTLNLAKKSSDGKYNNSNYGTYKFYFNSSNNYVAGTVSGSAKRDANNLYNTSIVPTGVWHDANLKIITETDSSGTKHLKVYMYVDGKKHIMCETTNTVAFDDVGINTIFFDTTNTDKNRNVHTYIKNLRVDYEDTDPTIYNTVLFDEANITTGENGAFTAKATSTGVRNYSFKSSENSSSHYYADGTYNNVEYACENGALKVVLTPNTTETARHAAIQYFAHNGSSYFPADTTKYMQMSYDIKNPSGSESALKEQEWRFGNNTGSTASSIYTITSRIYGNKISFYNENTYDGDEVTKKSVEFSAESDKWYRIIKLLKVTNTGSKYNIHAECYVKDLATDKIYKIYESDEVIPGGTGFVFSQQRTDIVTAADAEQKPVVTYYDNFTSRIWDDNFSDKYINRVTDSATSDNTYDIELNCYDGANAVAKARDVAGIGAKKLILAAYHGNELVDIIVSTDSNITDSEKGIVELNMDISGKGVNKLKAFFFDGITTCKPLATSPEVEVN